MYFKRHKFRLTYLSALYQVVDFVILLPEMQLVVVVCVCIIIIEYQFVLLPVHENLCLNLLGLS